MTKIIAILCNGALSMSGSYTSSNEFYKEFVSDFKQKKIRFGSMAEDKMNYSSDFNSVFNDYKKATINFKENITIGKETKKSK